ncbi:MAG: cupin domain-containing protein [Acidobacteria bacterium]|nr:cupin domain-containing protein [Acidobacteriota bacterium]
MPLLSLDAVPIREIFPGFRARIIHSARSSQSWVDIDAGASFPEHQHPHEQIVNVLDGELELNVDGESHRLTRGVVFVIPPDVPHSGRAITACQVLDLFAPVREDYK